MKYYSTGNIPKTETPTTYYNKKGDPLDEKQVHKQAQYAAHQERLVTRRRRKKEGEGMEAYQVLEVTYFIRTHQHIPLDPLGPYGKRDRNLDTKMTKVSKNTFDFYVTYLKTNNSIYLTKATRGVMND